MQKGKHGILRPFLLTFVILLLLIIFIPLFFKITIDLTGHKAVVESSVSEVLGRDVRVDGTIKMTTSLWPYFEIREVSIANPEGFDKDNTADMGLVRLNVGLLSLLKDRIRIRKLRVEGLTLDLQRNKYGVANWVFAKLAARVPAKSKQAETRLSEMLAVDELTLENIEVRLQDDFIEQNLELSIEHATGSAVFGEPMDLFMNGSLRNHPFTMEVKANSLAEFLAMTHSRLDVEMEFAKTRLHFSGSGNVRGPDLSTVLEASIEGERFGDLDDLFAIDLPPLEDYRLATRLVATRGRLELNDIEVTVKSSTLNGSIVIDKTGAKPFVNVALSADTIQLADFDTGDWSPDAQPLQHEATESAPEPIADRAAVLSQETLSRLNSKWEVKVNDVLSGEDKLGNGEISIELKDGRIELDALRLNLPKSKLLLKASVKPDHVDTPASLRILVENFDIGPLTRLSNPESKLSGPLNIDMDITSSMRGIRGFFKNANGYFNVSGSPENTRSDAVDLWAVNLLSSIVESSDKDDSKHKINCLISRWSLQNGLMTADNIAVDTSRIRICADGEIDFNQQTINLRAFPTAKRPEFFSLATPIAVNGKFEDFRVGAEMGLLAIVPTAIKFAISPITTPIKRLVREDLPADGADICSLPISPHEGEPEKLPGC